MLQRIISVALLVSACFAQQNHTFLWRFLDASQLTSTSVPACGSLSISIIPLLSNQTSPVAVPPFYMLAFAPSGVSSKSFIGTDPNNLSWLVDQPPGQQLLLTVEDGVGSVGGFGPQPFVVASGTSTCIPPRRTDLALIASETNELSTCDPWSLLVTGGSPPYNITIAASNSTTITVVPLVPTNDVLRYINRVDPSTQVMATVSDSKGTYGNSTSFVQTTGPSDTSCIGHASQQGNSTQMPSLLMSPATHANGLSKAVIALIVLLPVLVVVASVIFWLRRRAIIGGQKGDTQDTLPRGYATTGLESGSNLPSKIGDLVVSPPQYEFVGTPPLRKGSRQHLHEATPQSGDSSSSEMRTVPAPTLVAVVPRMSQNSTSPYPPHRRPPLRTPSTQVHPVVSVVPSSVPSAGAFPGRIPSNRSIPSHSRHWSLGIDARNDVDAQLAIEETVSESPPPYRAASQMSKSASRAL